MTGDVTRPEIVRREQDDGSGGTAPDPTGSGEPARRPDRRLSVPLIVSLALGGLLVVGAAAAGLLLGPQQPTQTSAPTRTAAAPVALPPVAAPQAGAAACAALLRALPATLPAGTTPLPARQLASPVPPGAVAWGGGDPVVLRCGVTRPAGLTPTSETENVDGVTWFSAGVPGAATTTLYAINCAPMVLLTVPGTVTDPGPVQAVSTAIAASMPEASPF